MGVENAEWCHTHDLPISTCEAIKRAEAAERERDAAREALRVFRAFIQRWYDVRFPGKAPNETLWVAFRQEALSLNENEKVRAARMGGG